MLEIEGLEKHYGDVKAVQGLDLTIQPGEMREYKPSRVHAAAQKKKDKDGTEELQTGRKYLFTIGRTDKLFGDTPNDLINGCIRADGGGPKAFNVF